MMACLAAGLAFSKVFLWRNGPIVAVQATKRDSRKKMPLMNERFSIPKQDGCKHDCLIWTNSLAFGVLSFKEDDDHVDLELDKAARFIPLIIKLVIG